MRHSSHHAYEVVELARRGESSLKIAAEVLEESGFTVLETFRKIKLGEVEAGEVDIIAEGPRGLRYAVEVKAGRAGVSDVRQAYVNAVLLDLKPMLVCKGLADDAAQAVAEELGVEVLQFPDYYILLEGEELEYAVREAVADTLSKAIKAASHLGELAEHLAASQDILEASRRAGCAPRELARELSRLRREGRIPRKASFKLLKLAAQIALLKATISERLSRIEGELAEVRESLRKIQDALSSLS